MAKILIISSSPFFIVRGTPIRTKEFVLGLLKYNHEVDVLTYPIGKDILEDKIRIIRPKAKFYKKTSAGPSFLKIPMDLLLLKEGKKLCKKKKYDFIFGIDSEAAFVGILLKKKFKIKLIADFHNTFSQNLKGNGWWFAVPFAKPIEKFLFKNPDYIFANSPRFKEHLQKKYSLKNIGLILDYVNNKEEKPSKKLPKKYIAYAGNSKSYQGVPNLLLAFKKVYKKYEDIELVIAGNMDNNIKKMIFDINIDTRVKLLGVQTIEQTNYILKRSIFNVIPKKVKDSLPQMKALHYLQNKNPILATDSISTRMYLKHLKNGYLVEPNPEDLFKGMDRLLSDKKLRDKIKDYIEKHQEKQDIAELLNTAIKSLQK